MDKKPISELSQLIDATDQAESLADLAGVDNVSNKVAKVNKTITQANQAMKLGSQAVNAVQSASHILTETPNLDANDEMMSERANMLFSLFQRNPSGLQFTLSCLNLPDTTFKVISFELKERYNTLYEADIVLTSADSAVDFSAVLDNRVTLKIWQDGQLQRQIHGMASDFEQGDSGFRQSFYRLRLAPDLWRATLRRNSRIFQAVSVIEILEVLLKEHGITQYAFTLRHAHEKREFCVQYQESDFDFIQRLVAEEGLFYYFEQQESQHVIVFNDDAESLDNEHAVILPYNLNRNAQLQEKSITTFRRSERVRPSHTELKDYTFKKPNWQASFSQEAKDVENQRSIYEHFDYPGRFKNDEQGDAFSRYRLDSLRNDAHQGFGESNSAEIYPGRLLLLSSHPNIKINTFWQPIGVHYQGVQPQASEQEAGDGVTSLTGQFKFIPRHQTWRPQQRIKPRVEGPQIAVVVGPKGEEIYCDNFGRIRLQFLWDRYGKSDDHSSCWIRVTQPWAGKGWGMLAIPRIGQEVVVDFLDGDPDQPIVTGRTYHATNMPPGSLPASKTQMHLASQTYKGGGYNGMMMEDATDNQRLDIQAQKDMNTTVLNNRLTTVKAEHTENINGNQNISIVGNRQHTIKSLKLSSVDGEQIQQIQGSKTLKSSNNTIISSSKGNIYLSIGKSSITLTNDGQISIDGSGNVTVNGKKVIFNNHSIAWGCQL